MCWLGFFSSSSQKIFSIASMFLRCAVVMIPVLRWRIALDYKGHECPGEWQYVSLLEFVLHDQSRRQLETFKPAFAIIVIVFLHVNLSLALNFPTDDQRAGNLRFGNFCYIRNTECD